MTSKSRSELVIKGARTNNLKNISLNIPHGKFIAVTGISGSGKSSLVFEVIAKEGQRRYFETLPSFARQFMGKLNRPDVEEIEGLSPVIAIGQQTAGIHARSTVGTMSDIYDLLRLLYARTGTTEKNIELSRALFSFNSAVGKCARCNGIGKEEQIDLNKLISHPEKTIREGALAPTLPNGYIMYSQVTIDVLNQVCEAEGFNVDVSWVELTPLQRKIILHGSDKIKVPFGKHSLESRLKWTGIKAKPREEGYYKGMIPIMSDILRRDRNANILKYVHAVTCPECQGKRLNEDALSVIVHSHTIAELVQLELNQLKSWIKTNSWGTVAKEITDKIEAQVDLLEDLGLGHLTLDRPSRSLRTSEIQRIRVANQLVVPLSDVLYVFDEPSVGLHPDENARLIYHFKQLVKKGNTVIVVEHDLDTLSQAEHIIEIGPKAGKNGGEVMFNGPRSEFLKQKKFPDRSLTTFDKSSVQRLKGSLCNKATDGLGSSEGNAGRFPFRGQGRAEAEAIHLKGCHHRNLKNIDVKFQLGKLNVVSGRSGVGKSSLVKGTLINAVKEHLGMEVETPAKITGHQNLDAINKLIFIDHSPIGKTPRSNPATYLGISDHIRDVYAKLPEAKVLGFSKSRFSFNTKGGRCETCQGAGKTQIGMHFLGNVDLLCGTCNGDRFNDETLKVKYNGLSIAEVYKLSVNEAVEFFSHEKKVLVGLEILKEIGLGYLRLGQSSTTLSGGEAQRIKIANQLQKKDTGNTLYVIIEPSIGLHHNDIQTLLQLFDKITERGNTIVSIEQDESIIKHSDWHIELGHLGKKHFDKQLNTPLSPAPKSGSESGDLVYEGTPRALQCKPDSTKKDETLSEDSNHEIVLNGVTTHGLKNINVRIPKNQLTVVTGVSGSGKSSLVYDTLFSESNARFTESLSTYNRSFLQQNSQAEIASFSGLGPAIGINRRGGSLSKRSTVGTLSGVYDAFRLLYSRIAQHNGEVFTAQHFSFNHHLGACEACEGLGVKRQCDSDQIIVSTDKSILDGAVSMNKSVGYYADLNGQFMATLKEAAQQNNWNLELPWNQLSTELKDIVLYGTGGTEWDVTWEYATKSRKGTQELKAKWRGLCNYIDDEFQRKIHNKNTKSLEELQHDVLCQSCGGSRLKTELLRVQFLGKNIFELSKMSIASCLDLLKTAHKQKDKVILAISNVVIPAVKISLKTMSEFGLGYLNLNRTVSSLSGGERQRVTLAGQLSAHLFGVTYVLDEPSRGLDEAQVKVMAGVLKKIVQNGNTVVVVEHDKSFIKEADYLIELGPKAGSLGGEVIYQGSIKDLVSCKKSVTYQLLYSKEKSAAKKSNQARAVFGVKSANANNLKNVNVDFRAGQITAVSGVSGSGKSSLVKDVMFSSWKKNRAVNCAQIHGMDQFEEVYFINQEALTQNRLSTPVTITGIMEQIKTLFSKTEMAKAAGLKRADFSYQSKNGKCPTCSGYGKVKTSMDFMSDIWLKCDTCNGTRYSQVVLGVNYQGKSIGEVLELTVAEAMLFFGQGAVVESLETLERVGVGHIKLGQAGNTLSGGEAQRLKLATAILTPLKGATLYLFDEPSTGLHYFDILKLIEVFQSLIDSGDTVIFIEHNAAMVDAADAVVELGPGSGEFGGDVVNQ